MSQSNIHRYIQTLTNRHKEISLLISHAKDLFDKNDIDSEELYKSTCRSISILLVSHLEGFIKDFTKEIILDINQFISFQDINSAVKRQYVSSFMGDIENNNTYNKKVKNLIRKFEEIDNNFKEFINSSIEDEVLHKNYIQVSSEPFLFKDNKNPKSHVLLYVCKNFGIKNIFANLKESELEIVFQNDRLETNTLIEKIYNKLIVGTRNYPFSINYDEYNLQQSEILRGETTNWEAFLNNLLHIRHQIVHGSTLENISNHIELKEFEQKTILIQYGIILLLIEKNFNNH